MEHRQKISSGAPWEPVVGYSRAVRVGQTVYVSGTTATDEAGTVVGSGDPYAQTRQALSNIARALRAAGATMGEVVRTRIFVVNIDHWREIGQAHGEVFGTTRPATTMVEVRRLIHPEMLVEIEAEAVIANPPHKTLRQPRSNAARFGPVNPAGNQVRAHLRIIQRSSGSDRRASRGRISQTAGRP